MNHSVAVIRVILGFLMLYIYYSTELFQCSHTSAFTATESNRTKSECRVGLKQTAFVKAWLTSVLSKPGATWCFFKLEEYNSVTQVHCGVHISATMMARTVLKNAAKNSPTQLWDPVGKVRAAYCYSVRWKELLFFMEGPFSAPF